MTDHEPLPPPAFRLYTDAELAALPPPRMAIAGHLPAGGLALVYGAPGCGKSFLLLDMLCSIAALSAWHGFEVISGPIVYVAAGEGTAGLSRRIESWKYSQDISQLERARFVHDPVQLHVPAEVMGFCDVLEKNLPEPPSVIAFDTLARCMVGADENSARDMGQAVAGADYVREKTGATVILSHHTQKNEERERGSSALIAAADTVMAVKDEEGIRTLKCKKQKDAEPFENWRFALQSVGDSCVVATVSSGGLMVVSGRLTDNQYRALETLRDIDVGSGATTSTWLDSSGLPKSSFHRVVKQLMDAGYVEGGKRQRYQITEQGAGRLVSVSPSLMAVS